MTTAVMASDSRDWAVEVHSLLKQLDPSKWRPEFEQKVRTRIGEMRAALSKLLESMDSQGAFASVHAALTSAQQILRDKVPPVDLSGKAAKNAWNDFRKLLLDAYDDLSKSLEAWDIHVPSMRPTNYARNIFHVSWASLAALTLAVYPTHTVLMPIIVSIFTWAWTMEYLRRDSEKLNAALLKMLGWVAHPHERHRVNSATWYATALLILTVLGVFTPAMIGVVVLGVADPMAAVIGRRWGRTSLVNGRTLEGTAAFIVSGTIASGIAMVLAHPEISIGLSFTAALFGAIAGGLAELFSRRVDDNFTIPLSAAAGAAIVLAIAGVPLGG